MNQALVEENDRKRNFRGTIRIELFHVIFFEIFPFDPGSLTMMIFALDAPDIIKLSKSERASTFSCTEKLVFDNRQIIVHHASTLLPPHQPATTRRFQQQNEMSTTLRSVDSVIQQSFVISVSRNNNQTAREEKKLLLLTINALYGLHNRDLVEQRTLDTSAW